MSKDIFVEVSWFSYLVFYQRFFSSVHFGCSVVFDSLRPYGLQHARPPNTQGLLKLMSIKSVMPSKHLILCHPCLLLPSFFLSIRAFSSVSSSHQKPKYWSFSLSISPSNEYPGQIAFRTAWFDLLEIKESFPELQFKSMNFLALRFLYCPTLTSIHDYWKNHSFDKMDLCWQTNVSAF